MALSNPEPPISWNPIKASKVLPPVYGNHGEPLTAQVDLIVPFHGQYEHVSRLVQTLWEGTRGICYNLCLVDDGSPNSDFIDRIEGKKWASVVCVRHDSRRGFGAAVNSGIRATTSPWVVILNSDVWFEDGVWLKRLGEAYHALSATGVKMVSARFPNSPPGDPRVSSEEDGDHAVLDPENIDQIMGEDVFLPLVCALAHRDLFNKLGLLKEYPLGWYEDVEFACRMHARGFRQAVAGGCLVGHAGQATVNAVCDTPHGPWNPQRGNKRVFESNYDRCLEDVRRLR